MTRLEVDGILLAFDEPWFVAKWDDSDLYRDGIQGLTGTLKDVAQGTKAMDVVGLYQDDPYLFEVKDFRGHAIANKARDLDELPLEIGLKARDTIAGLVGLVSKDHGAELPHRWLNAVRQEGRTVRVVALIAEDDARPGEALHKRDVRQSERLNRLKRYTAWLTARVLVKDPLRDTLMPHLAASSLAGAGRARPR